MFIAARTLNQIKNNSGSLLNTDHILTLRAFSDSEYSEEERQMVYTLNGNLRKDFNGQVVEEQAFASYSIWIVEFSNGIKKPYFLTPNDIPKDVGFHNTIEREKALRKNNL